MDRYVLPRIGAMPVDKVGSAAVYEVRRPIALAGKHATVQMAGPAITAVLEWARIAEFRAEGSPVETVRRRLPKRVGGGKHYISDGNLRRKAKKASFDDNNGWSPITGGQRT